MVEIRRKLVGAVGQLPALTAYQTKLEGIARLMLGGSKMPLRVVSMMRGAYAVRACVGGVMFTAAVFPALGARENHKLVAPVTRLSDAIAYHFRASRMRSASNPYNLSLEQAREDARLLSVELEDLSKLLVECGVAVMNNADTVSAIEWGSTKCDERDLKLSEYKAIQDDVEGLRGLVKVQGGRIDSTVKHGFEIEARCKEEVEHLRNYVDTLQTRITELERLVCVVHKPVDAISKVEVVKVLDEIPFSPINPPGIPASF